MTRLRPYITRPARAQFNWTEIDYSNIVFAFQAAYAIGLLIVGRIIDRLGVRTGFSFAVVLWSLRKVVASWKERAHEEDLVTSILAAGMLSNLAAFVFSSAPSRLKYESGPG